MMIKLAFLLSVLVSSVFGYIRVGDRCRSNDECPHRSYCKVISPSCNGGVCACIPGFVHDESDAKCKRLVYINGRCESGDKCASPFASCKVSTCVCDDHFKAAGAVGNDKCISRMSTKYYGDTCFDSIECPPAYGPESPGMACVENKCACYPGYKKVNPNECQEKTVGDSCTGDEDCINTPNSECRNGLISCFFGFRKVEYMKTATRHSFACIRETETLIEEGKNCTSVAQTLPGSSGICKKPFVCTQCDAMNYICGRVVPTYLNGSKGHQVLSICALGLAMFFAQLLH